MISLPSKTNNSSFEIISDTGHEWLCLPTGDQFIPLHVLSFLQAHDSLRDVQEKVANTLLNDAVWVGAKRSLDQLASLYTTCPQRVVIPGFDKRYGSYWKFRPFASRVGSMSIRTRTTTLGLVKNGFGISTPRAWWKLSRTRSGYFKLACEKSIYSDHADRDVVYAFELIKNQICWKR